MADEFEKITAGLEDLNFRETYIESNEIIVNATISAGRFILEHEEDYTCDDRIIIIILHDSTDSPYARFAIPMDTPLGHALISGEFAATVRERLDDLG